MNLTLLIRPDRPAVSHAGPMLHLRGADVVEPSHGKVGTVTHVAEADGTAQVTLEVDGDLLARLNNEPRPVF